MSSSAFPLATLLLVAAGAGLIALAMSEDSEETKQQETGAFRSRVFDMSPTRGSEDRGEDEVDAEHGADPSAGQWLSDSLAQLEQSYQAMRQQGEELAQEAIHTQDNEAQPEELAEPESAPLVVTPSPITAATGFVQPIDAELPADQLSPLDPNAQDELLADDAAGTEQTLATTDAGAVPNSEPTQGAAPGEAKLSPEEAARAEQLRIAVALENEQVFILSLLPLFLQLPGAQAAVPSAGAPAAPMPTLNMSGLAWGPVDTVGTTSP